MQSPRTQWLGATALHSQDKATPALITSLTALVLQNPQLHMLVNFFDATPVNPQNFLQRHAQNSSALLQLEGTAVPGMKTLFWYKYLTPARTRHLQLVWVFDCDIAVHPSVFPLSQLAGALMSTRATLLQPSIQAFVHGTYHPWLRVKKAHMSCLATTAQWVEMQTPLFAGDAWARFHEKVLAIIPEEGLVTSDFGLDIIWCAFLREEFPQRPTCLVTPSAAATHLNSHAIEAYMSKEVRQKERSCTTTCQVLFKNFKSYWKNFSHHTGECYSVRGHYGLSPLQSRYSIDGDGMIRARNYVLDGDGIIRARGHGSLSSQSMAADAAQEETEAEKLSQVVKALPRGVGATSVDPRDSRRLSMLSLSLSKLCNAVPGLTIVVNINEKESGKGRPSRGSDISLDARIRTTYISGPRALFWKRVLTGAILRDPLDYVWLFEPSLAVHPSSNPLAQLVHVMRSTEAYLVYPRPLSPPNAPVANAPSQGHPEDTGCAVSTVRNAPLSLSTVIKADAWKLLHGSVLARYDEAQLEKLEPGFEMLFCGLISQRWGDTGRPACIEAQTLFSTRLAERREQVEASLLVGRSCDSQGCEAPLRRAYPNAFNTSMHDDGRCWAAGPRGLNLLRWTRKPPYVGKRRGVPG